MNNRSIVPWWKAIPLLALCLAGCGLGRAGDAEQRDASSSDTDLRTWVVAVVECLHEAGWDDVSVSADGSGLELDNLPTAQRAAFGSARSTCEEAVGPQPNAAPMTHTEVEALYGELVTAKACLSGLGYVISEPPSKAQFVESYFTDQGPWYPYAELPELAAAQWDRINEVCPQPR